MVSSGTKVTGRNCKLADPAKKLLDVASDTPLNPASSIKTFYRLYGRFENWEPTSLTRLTLVLKSDQSVCVRGGGDPSFVMEDLYLLVEASKA